MATQTDTEITSATLAEIVQTSAIQVFDMMVSLPITSTEWTVHKELRAFNGVVGMITFTGDWIGAGLFYCDEELACLFGSKMLMVEVAQVDADVLDGVGELSNMILGSVKEALEKRTGPLALGIPTVVYGKNFMARPGVHSAWIETSFEHEGREFADWTSIQAV